MEETHTTAWRGRQGRPLFPKGQACCRGGPGAAKGSAGHRGRGYKKGEDAWTGGLSEALSEGPWGCLECSDLTDGPSLATPEAEEHNADTQSIGGSGIPEAITLALRAGCLRALG